MRPRIKIILAEDQQLTRQGYISLLETERNIEIIGEAENGVKLIEMLSFKSPDIILMDIEMPEMDGICAAKSIREKYPQIRIIFLSMYFEFGFLEEFKNRGYNGFLPKDADIDCLVEAINKTFDLGNSFDISERLMKKLSEKKISKLSYLKKIDLTLRELEVLDLLCNGKSNKEIAAILNVCDRTVEHHKTSLFRKTNSSSNAALISLGLKSGLGL